MDQELQSTLGSAGCRQTGHFARDCLNRGSRDESHSHVERVFRQFFLEMVHDQSTTLITKPGTPRAEMSVDGTRASTNHQLCFLWARWACFYRHSLSGAGVLVVMHILF